MRPDPRCPTCDQVTREIAAAEHPVSMRRSNGPAKSSSAHALAHQVQRHRGTPSPGHLPVCLRLVARWGVRSFVADDPESAAISRRAPGSRAQPFARRSSGATPSHAMASRPAIASRLQAHALVGRTAELGSMDFAVKAWVAKTFHPEQRSVPVLKTIVAYWNSRLPVRSPFR